MAEAWTRQEMEELKRLLLKVRQNNGFWPDEDTMRVAHGTVSYWAPELVIVEKNEILLAQYDGGIQEFQGQWHLPGGYNKWHEMDIQATCTAIAKRELKTDVTFHGVVNVYKWKTGEHPYGHPLSVYAKCSSKSPIVETAKIRFFPLEHLPVGIIDPHDAFIKEFYCGAPATV
jgi:ADP-ribose pyrophosphatase YjhB (NUDIX family)